MKKNPLYEKIAKSSSLSTFIVDPLKKKEYLSTNVLALNLLFGGAVDRGIPIGKISQFSADSTLGKSQVGLSLLKQAQDRGMTCFILDSEHSWNPDNARAHGIDVENVEILDTGEIVRLKQFFMDISSDGNDKNGCTKFSSREDRANIFVLFDSFGRTMSQSVLDKAVEGNASRDMGLPFFRNELANTMAECGVTVFVINHVYSNTGGYGEPFSVPGGKRLYFVSDSLVMATSAAKDKDGDEIKGKIISAAVRKGRDAIEFKKLKYRIMHGDEVLGSGLDPWYGLLDLAVDLGFVTKPKPGCYSRVFEDGEIEEKTWKEKDLYVPEFWAPLFQRTDLAKKLENEFSFREDSVMAVSKINVLDMIKKPSAESKSDEPKGDSLAALGITDSAKKPKRKSKSEE